ncbi:hypothetical protein QWY75_04810 [Pontixanthobacter aestiaquae]|uniref:Uncharacterized protein n=1 Tax=Pontixanthobacter aestiaquae TaxID=1509367 RepID=A0A844Z919_9SPHN|nr:hypothetical protein [Pontixanthobacter aestiaquae]MDN3645529.1 hypothetical protein [Pontixanthobacter aestiaquae]MXO83473.1 hypothetical protein [Pontixanthobacter aestiaquae]
MNFGQPTLMCAVLLGGCATMADEPVPVMTSVSDEQIISTTSSVANTLVLDKNTRFVTCTAPAPDASFNQGSQASISGLVAIGGANDSGSIGEGEESRETGLGGRSPAVLFSRDIFFRACEFSRNYELEKNEAIDLYKTTLEAASTAFQNEASATNEVMTKAADDTAELEEPNPPSGN